MSWLNSVTFVDDNGTVVELISKQSCKRCYGKAIIQNLSITGVRTTSDCECATIVSITPKDTMQVAMQDTRQVAMQDTTQVNQEVPSES